MSDPINPDHYKTHFNGIECISVTEGFNFNIGNVIKYVWRAGQKPGAALLTDLHKARWYLNREISRWEKQNEVESRAALDELSRLGQELQGEESDE